jgi:hypothetical protein
MKNLKLSKNFKKGIIFIFILSCFLGNFPMNINRVEARYRAPANLIKANSFENDIDEYWGFWNNPESNRTYDFFRSYDAPFGSGSYSATISANGNPEDSFNAILSTRVSNNKFTVNSEKKYLLIFYAKASQDLDLITYLQRTDNYEAISAIQAKTISTNWKKIVVSVAPTVSTEAVLAFVLGDMPANSSLYLDNIQLFEQNFSLETPEVRGIIKSQNKAIRINGMTNFVLNDIDIELPYLNNTNGEIETKRFKPDSINSNTAYFKMHEKTFSGVAKVYICDIYLGSFNYGVDPKISGIHPALVRMDNDLVVFGSGINPVKENTYLVLNAIDNEKKAYQAWIKPENFDSELSQASFHLPAGIISGTMYLQTSYTDKDGNNKINKSNSTSYKLKPVVYATDWSKKGYEQIGDKLRIQGKGFGLRPAVIFHDENDNILETKAAQIVGLGDVEIIEVETTKKTNVFNISVISEGIESDYSESLDYLAKPKITSISASHSRSLNTADEIMPAAKVGETLRINGYGFALNKENIQVEFQGNNDARIRSLVASTSVISSRRGGDYFSVSVPEGAVSGYMGLVINSSVSNYFPLEIIPTVLNVSPNPIVPGNDIIIRANGVKNNLNLTKIHFKIDNNNVETVSPHSIVNSLNYSDIYVKVPLSFSANNSSFTLQYDRWKDDGSSVLNILAHIVNASINMDNKILSIKGYGFSILAKENIITYRYADEDQTIIEPQVRILGVYPSEEGQEIRIQILDDYHYGNVSVQVGENTSNQVNFGPASVSNIARRIEYVESLEKVMGVLYISGYNFGSGGGVQIGEDWAEVHYRNDFFIIAVVPEANLYNNPLVVVRE